MMKVARFKDSWRIRRADVAALATIALVFCAAFGWAIFRGKFLIGGDVFFYTYPMRTVAWRMIRHGELPLWTPFVLSGFPLLAMVQLGLAYPLTWTHLFLPDHWAEEIYVLAPFLLAPAFTYAYAREIGRSRPAALLAGLAFGYSGLTTNALGMNGIPTNAMMWLPLLLIALERSRKRLLTPLLGATGAYALSVLTGHAQSFLLVGLVGAAYAFFLVLAPTTTIEKQASNSNEQVRRPSFRSWARWRPLIVVACAHVLAFGVAAFQILETLRAARRSIRHSTTYDFFSQGSFTPRELILSFVAPLYHYIDVTAYVAPLACVLALYAVVRNFRQHQGRDARIWLWLAVAVTAFIFMLGEHTPLYHLVYHVPFLNLFRVPSRHAFEWTFALAVLAAYGWDALCETYRAPQRTDTTEASDRRQVFIVAALTGLCALVGAFWFLSVKQVALFGLLPSTQAGGAYLLWKILFTIGVLFIVWRAFRLGESPWRKILLSCGLLLGCMGESLILIPQWWQGTAKPGARFTTPGKATRYLQQSPPEANRVYTYANLGVDEDAAAPRVDVLDQPAAFGIQNAGGYEPFLLERYSRAFGDVDYDAVRPLAGHSPRREVFEPQSHVLDLLNVTHVVAFSDLTKPPPVQITRHKDIDFAADDVPSELKPGETITFSDGDAIGDTLVLVTSLANAVLVAQNAPAARVRICTTMGGIIERELLAGRDTAEWAHERADVRALMKHKLAPVFDSLPGDAANSFSARRYWTRIALDGRAPLSRIEITNSNQSASLAVWKATLYDSASKHSTPLARPVLNPKRWQTAAEFAGVLVLRNERALPRAWLVTEAEAVDGEEALRRIRGVSKQPFDPRHTALVEIHVDDLPHLAGGELAAGSSTRIASYQSNRLMIETNAPTPTVLVVSEIFYPGWEATVDGQPARILVTDYLLRGVALPAGAHKVEMHYAAPAARNGTIITSLTMLLLVGLTIFARRQWGRS